MEELEMGRIRVGEDEYVDISLITYSANTSVMVSLVVNANYEDFEYGCKVVKEVCYEELN